MLRNVPPRFAEARAGGSLSRDAKRFGNLLECFPDRAKLPHGDNAVACQSRVKVLFALGNHAENVSSVDAVAAVGDVFQIVNAVVGRNAVLVVDAKAVRARADEGSSNKAMNAKVPIRVAAAQSDIQMAGSLTRRRDYSRLQRAGSLAVVVFYGSGNGSHSPTIRNLVEALKTCYGQPTLSAIRILLSHDSHLVCGLWLEPADADTSVRLVSF